MNDHTLLAEFVVSRKPDAFAELVSRYESLVRGAALRETADAHLAEDITQSTMMTLMVKAPQIARHQPIGPWLLRVCHFLCIDALRTDSTRRRHEQIAAGQRTELQSVAVINQPIDSVLDSVLDRALNSLRDNDRTILVLRYLQGWSFEQIAGELNISMTATRQRLSRAIARLRALLDEQGVKRDEILPLILPPLIAELNNYLRTAKTGPNLPRAIRKIFHPWPIAVSGALVALVGGAVIARVVIHRPAGIATPTSVQPLLNSRPNSTIP